MTTQSAPITDTPSAEPTPLQYEEVLQASAEIDAAHLVRLVTELSDLAEMIVRSGKIAKAKNTRAIPPIYSRASASIEVICAHLKYQCRLYRLCPKGK